MKLCWMCQDLVYWYEGKRNIVWVRERGGDTVHCYWFNLVTSKGTTICVAETVEQVQLDMERVFGHRVTEGNAVTGVI